jgi:hypothetical protein
MRKLLFVLIACSLYAQTGVTTTAIIPAASLIGVIQAVPPNATGATYTTDTAANLCHNQVTMIAQLIAFTNTGLGTITIVGGTGVTIKGTATIAAGASRLFMHWGTCSAWTFQSLGTFTGL